MNLKELIKKLKQFDCEALSDKEVVHLFVSSNAYGYKEIVEDVVYNASQKMFVIQCSQPQQCNWDEKAIIHTKDKKGE